MAEIYSHLAPSFTLDRLFPTGNSPTPKHTLRHIRLLDCNSCNTVSDALLKIIYCFNPVASVINYYGEDLGLFKKSFEDVD